MKNLLVLSIAFLFFSLIHSFHPAFASVASASADQLTVSANPQSGKAHLAGDLEVNFEKKQTVANLSGGFISNNWGVLTLSLLAFAETIVRLTPSEKDNSILKLISTILNSIIPNLKKGGGVF